MSRTVQLKHMVGEVIKLIGNPLELLSCSASLDRFECDLNIFSPYISAILLRCGHWLCVSRILFTYLNNFFRQTLFFSLFSSNIRVQISRKHM